MSAGTIQAVPPVAGPPDAGPPDAGPPDASLATPAGLWHVLAGWRPRYVLAVACNVVALLAQTGAVAAGAWAIAIAFAGGAPGRLWAPALLAGAAVVVRATASWVESWLSHDLSFRIQARVRLWVYDAVARLSPAGLTRRRDGELLTSSLSDAEALEIYYAHASIYTLTAWVGTPLLWLWLATVSLPAALVTAPVLAVAVTITLVARRWSRAQGGVIRSTLATLGGEVAENAGAVREIVGYGLLPARRARLDRLDGRLRAAQFRNARRAGAETAALGVVALLASIAAAAAAAWQLGQGGLSPAAVPLVVVLAAATTAPVLQWASMTRHYGTTQEAAARIEALFGAEPPVASYGDRPAPGPDHGTGAARSVGFSWHDVDPEASTRLAVEAVSVTVRQGEHVAVAGRSGSGKSTFAQLLARFVDPGAGTIDAAGHPLPDYARDELANVVSLLPQDVSLFAETARDNLLLATDEPVGDDVLWSALRAARADGIVEALPDGLDTVLADNGRSLSGGERQRLALARAILHPSAVLVLDEAVSQLDVLSERDVHDALTGARAGRTTITIAHRLSTLLAADRILVLDDGRLVGDGTHEELLAGCPAYRRLVLPQLEAAR
jgi:ABC-type multidrug transport system fused ATPase/permease subunit